MIGLEPDLLWKCENGKASLCHAPKEERFQPEDRPALESLRHVIGRSHIPIPSELPPMAAGLIGYMGYDMIRLVEDIPDSNDDTLDVPDALLMRPTIMLVFDNVVGDIYLVTPIRPDDTISAEQAHVDAKARLSTIADRLNAPLPVRKETPHDGDESLEFQPNMTRADYYRMVEKAKEYIRAGDIFQVVPSQRFTAPFPHSPMAFYRSLRRLNPSPFLFFLQFGSFQLIGSSPEILVRLRDGTVTVRPIAGTRKRGETAEEDLALEADLLADEKEIAEHLMLLDLGRNDVGRVSQAGSVTVTERMIVERYSHVMHIVSNVEGIMDAKTHDALDALMAGFPAGTVSGAPKIRAMEIIDELEPVKRKFYAGCVGYFSSNGSMDSCITLRTALIKDGQIHLQAGGGVVADSSPDAEYQESCNKAKALMKAAESAVKF
jgi:anthranilate synthase component 1